MNYSYQSDLEYINSPTVRRITVVVDNPEQLLGSREAQGQPWLGVINSQAAPHPSLVTDPPQVDQSD